MSIVIVGHVDHGKSTVIGRLLADTGSLPTGKLEQIRAYCEQNSMPFEYAFLIDALKDERRQNITIDSARVFFKSPKRYYIIIDAPGHIEFVKNMVTGAARAEAAILVIDAQEGVQENSRRHGNLLSLLGIHQVIVLINKMDLVDYDQKRFDDICEEYRVFLEQVGLKPQRFIPVSAREGDNISSCSEKMSWYQGPNVLEALDAFEKEKPLTDLPFRMPVQDVYRFTKFGDNRRIIAGTVRSGLAKVDDEIIFYPSGKKSVIRKIESMNGDAEPEIVAGQACGFTLGEQIYIKRGDIAVRAGDPPPRVAKRLRVSLFWLGKTPFATGKSYLLKLGTTRVRFKIDEILRVMNTSSLEDTALKKQVHQHEVAECILSLERPIAFDRADALPDTSRFVVVDDYEIRGGGIVLEDLSDAVTSVRESVLQRNIHWILSDVTGEERIRRYKQRSCLIIITGKRKSGRKQLARALESHLFHQGLFVYYLGMGSVVYGVDADIQSRTNGQGQREHIRRIAEISNLFLDAGLILIITAVEVNMGDLEIFQASVDPTRIATVWMGDEVTTDIPFQVKLADSQPVEQSISQILDLLQKNNLAGSFFAPEEEKSSD